ncbi:MAG TPA: hypothetical protein VNC22_16490 [Sporichthya sp.]|nr:hypothetical protein [Sporichthya sp.]
MATSTGRWVSVRFSDGRVRFDWIPADQPPPPPGQRGFWHVVPGGAHQSTRWEWHAAEPPPSAAARREPRTGVPPRLRPNVRVEPDHDEPPPALPVRAQGTVEVLPDRVYRPKRTMGLWFWLAAVILAAIGGAGAVAMTHDDRAVASLASDSGPEEHPASADEADDKPTKAGLTTVAQGYLNALLGGDIDDLLSYLDPSCDGADPGFAIAARWAKQVADGATVTVDEVEVHGRRGSVTDFTLDGPGGATADMVRRLISDEAPDGEQSFPWRFTDGEWYFKGECGSPVIPTPDDDTSTVPDGGSDDPEA